MKNIGINTVSALIIPLVILLAAGAALRKKEDVFAAMTTGATEGLSVIAKILPALIALLSAVYMLRASGAMDALAVVLAPAFRFFGLPPETAPLILIRPISGSGALAVGSEIMGKYGADSLIGRTAAIMLGSTETTFYTIAVYFGALHIKRTRYAIPAALVADFVGFVVAAVTARVMYVG
ncbi:MAG: spore maturation protein [Oscillospiraceae bacterium]|jgi:spore maturation protein B|nr:spore maturation protein [Oscillospiraceae bacterium]